MPLTLTGLLHAHVACLVLPDHWTDSVTPVPGIAQTDSVAPVNDSARFGVEMLYAVKVPAQAYCA